MFIIFSMLFEFIFIFAVITIIISAVKGLKKNKNKKQNSSVSEGTFKKEEPECLNEDLHNDEFHTYCDYCGSRIERTAKKCPSCGAKINKKIN